MSDAITEINRDVADLALHDAIYDILIRECGAIEHNRARFREFDLTQPLSSVRFGGQLGLDGRFAVDAEGRWYVFCDAEDRTPKRDAKIDAANLALAKLQRGR